MLITLVVIGVVAAITVPNLTYNHQEQTTLSGLKKTYSVLGQAFEKAIMENGTVNDWCEVNSVQDYPKCSKQIRENLASVMNTTKSCDYPNNKNCGIIDSKYRDGNKFTDSGYFSSFVATNGDVILVDARNTGNNTNRWCTIGKDFNKKSSLEGINNTYGNALYGNHCGQLIVDINGAKGPNKDGIDIFAFIIRKNGIVPAGEEEIHQHMGLDNCLGKQSYFIGTCTTWALAYQNIDYTRCPQKLGWTKAHTCN